MRSYAEEKENVPFLSLPASVPLSSVSAVGPAGFAVLSEDFTTICSTGVHQRSIEGSAGVREGCLVLTVRHALTRLI